MINSYNSNVEVDINKNNIIKIYNFIILLKLLHIHIYRNLDKGEKVYV